jgi:hypothetical protein
VSSDLPSDLLLHAAFGMLEGADRWLAERWRDLKNTLVEETSAAIVPLLRSLVSRHRDSGEKEYSVESVDEIVRITLEGLAYACPTQWRDTWCERY